jgi:carbon monoxide dehydrogenase subunit G
MRIEHEFTVAVPLAQAWDALAGADAVAACLPGAQLHAADGVQAGLIELADRGVACDATILGVDRDEDDHIDTVALRGRQRNGPGIGSATLRSRLSAADGSATRVLLSADVSSSGHRPGKEFEDAARRLLAQLGEGLRQRALELPGRAEPAGSIPRPRPLTDAPLEPPTGKPRMLKFGAAAAGAAALVAVVVLRRRRSAR